MQTGFYEFMSHGDLAFLALLALLLVLRNWWDFIRDNFVQRAARSVRRLRRRPPAGHRSLRHGHA